MGLREEIQSEVAAAFDEDLADAVSRHGFTDNNARIIFLLKQLTE